MNFFNDKSSKLMLQVLLIIILLHLGIKRYIQSFGSIRMYDIGASNLGEVKTINVPEEPEEEPEEESDEEDSDSDEEFEETDVETDYETDYETDGEDELKDYVIKKEQNGEVKGMKYSSEYQTANFGDERMDVASHVRLPKSKGEITYDLEVPTGKESEKIIADESVMNGGQLMDGIYGFDNMDSQYASL